MRKGLLAVVVLLVFLVAVPAANAADPKHSFGGFVNYISPTGEYSDPEVTVEADTAIGFGLNYRYMFNESWDFGASLFYAKHDVEASAFGMEATIGDISWMPILFDANWHFGKSGMFYVGPTLGYTFWDDLKLVDGTTVKVDDDVAYGANFGFDMPFSGNWAFNVGVRYLIVGAETNEGGESVDVDVDPFIVSVGASYRY